MPEDFSDSLGKEYSSFCVEEERFSWTIFSVYGDVIILSIPTACGLAPEGCTPISVNERWRIVASHNAALSVTAVAA